MQPWFNDITDQVCRACGLKACVPHFRSPLVPGCPFVGSALQSWNNYSKVIGAFNEPSKGNNGFLKGLNIFSNRFYGFLPVGKVISGPWIT